MKISIETQCLVMIHVFMLFEQLKSHFHLHLSGLIKLDV